MPLSESQKTVLSILSKNRSEESRLSGASGIHLSPRSLRYSGDIDLFHDSEEAVSKVSLNELQSQWSNSLTETRSFIHTRPASESGHLYLKPGCGTFFSPREGDDYQLHAPQAGGVLPRFGDSPSLVQSEEIKAQLKHFFGRRLLQD